MLLRKGDHVRLKVRTISGWKGTGTVATDQINDMVDFHKDGGGTCAVLRKEVSKIRR
jgi:hypothetical protein